MVASCKSKDDLKSDIAKEQERAKSMASETPVETKKVEGSGSAETKKEEAIPEPDPTDKKAVDEARKLAMIKSRYKDVIRFCEMGKIDEKSDQQARFGCALAACNMKEADKAKMWAKGIEKALFDQAIKVCTPLGVTL